MVYKNFNIRNLQKAVDHLKSDSILSKVIEKIGPLEFYPIEISESFEYLSKAIISQQLSIYASKSIIQKVTNLYDNKITPIKILNSDLIELKNHGVSNQKATYLKSLATEVLSKNVDFKSFNRLNNDEIIIELTKVKGIGTWTAKMFLIFAMCRTNIFPIEDLSFKEQITKLYLEKEYDNQELNKLIINLNSNWEPYQSIASRYLWKFKDLKLKL